MNRDKIVFSPLTIALLKNLIVCNLDYKEQLIAIACELFKKHAARSFTPEGSLGSSREYEYNQMLISIIKLSPSNCAKSGTLSDYENLIAKFVPQDEQKGWGIVFFLIIMSLGFFWHFYN